ncbi:hypothetical protein NP233_g635 [Leucocoprinus birnbaumii]|uniref:3'-5' exonuclease n=1 Tax=Leucocoprinus birnbaumii TaxID=56174 RepID=A0AAD5W1V2_9AGAR|nr:hypothetical protein NP233_g635 [Leucocoprinus birnbaumii]
MQAQSSSAPLSSASQYIPKAPEPATPYSWQEWHPNIQLIYIRNHRQANEELERLGDGPYGFDLEWKPNFVKGRAENRVALVQIANDETILLLQVSAMQEFPSKLYEFLANPENIKVGVGDAKKIYRDWNADLKNCVDLALLARTVDNERWKGKYTEPLGLARLVAVYEDRALAKGKITRSNWEQLLKPPQQTYAANDAHAGYVIYTRLMAMLPAATPQPKARYYSFDTTNGRLCNPFGRGQWQASNPNYDPGPPPPPREPKPPKPPKANNAAMIPSTRKTKIPVVRGPGSASPVPPAPQTTASFPGFILPYSQIGGSQASRRPSVPPVQMQPWPYQVPPYANPTQHYPQPGNALNQVQNSNMSIPGSIQPNSLYNAYEEPPNPPPYPSADKSRGSTRHTDNNT